MPRSATLNCSRCGHADLRRGRPYAAWRIAPWRVRPLLWLFNLTITLFVPPRPRCSWCHVSRSRQAQASIAYDPFLHHNPHSRDEMVLRRRAAILRPHASSGRWVPEDRHTVLRYLAWRDEGRCGLCAMPLPARQGQIEHVIPKKFGYFDFSKGRASPGTALESRLHHVDNLQPAHDYCTERRAIVPPRFNWPTLVSRTACRPSHQWRAHVLMGARAAAGADFGRRSGGLLSGADEFDVAGGSPARDRRASVGQQGAAQRLGEGDVAGVVGGDVLPQVPGGRSRGPVG